MTIEEVILMCLLLPIGIMAIIVAIIELVNLGIEKIELKNTVEKQKKIISAQNREIKAMRELIENDQQCIRTLLTGKEEKK